MNSLPDTASSFTCITIISFACLTVLCFSNIVLALSPEEILVIANETSPKSKELALYYLQRRKIPERNLVQVACPPDEQISREIFDSSIAYPIKKLLRETPAYRGIKCILLTYGIPLRITGGANTERKGASQDTRSTDSLPNETSRPEGGGAGGWQDTTASSVDSELMTVKEYGEYGLEGWIPNPLYIGSPLSGRSRIGRDGILMVSRIDGPDLSTAKRLVDDAIFVEQNGLSGHACFDCRFSPDQRLVRKDMYALFDRWMAEAGRMLQSAGIKTIMDERPELFRQGQCQRCALYCGWYSLGHYVDAFCWPRGAVAYHVASSECISLHTDNEQWCRMILLKGASATLGPVAEPYLQAFPPPNLFFRLLASNGLPLAQAYLLSCPVLSWQMVLLADPLYRPFLKGMPEH